MGASAFTDTVIGKYKSTQEAFNCAVEDAAHEHGHGGYTGTIAEKTSFKMVTCPPRVSPYKFAEKCIDNEEHFLSDKWGPAGCIEYTGAYLKKLKERCGHKGERGIRAFIFFGWASE